MNSNKRIEDFLKFQDEGFNFNQIAKKLSITPGTLRNFLNRKGYKSQNGKYILKKENNFKKENNKVIDRKIDNKDDKKSTKKSQKNVKPKNVKPKRDRKINITEEDLDKLCEVYDWYLQVKDFKNMKPKKSTRKKDILLEDENLKDLKSINIRVDKKTWEDFERLCSNSTFNKQQIITQALKDFMKEYKNLI